jgi:uncharacterized protein (TIGR02444 family)
MEQLESDNAFWRFSLRIYAAPGVAAECLAAQDRFGVDVNRLLFVAWLGVARGIVLDEAGLKRIDEAVADWSAGVVRPLRTARRALKQSPDIGSRDMQTLRKQIADTELLAEQMEQALLFRLTDDIRQVAAEPGIAAARGNIATYLAAHGPEAADFAVSSLLSAIASERS